MEDKISDEKLEYFFIDYEKRNPFEILFYMVITLGFYFIRWAYITNLKLEEIDDDAPDSRRAFIILFLFPIVWYLISFILTNLIFTGNPIIGESISILTLALIIFLSLQYTFQFCQSFGRVSNTSGLVWYLAIYPGYLGLVLVLFKIYYLVPLLFFTIISVSAMETSINIRYEKSKFKRQRRYFNSSSSDGRMKREN